MHPIGVALIAHRHRQAVDRDESPSRRPDRTPELVQIGWPLPGWIAVVGEASLKE